MRRTKLVHIGSIKLTDYTIRRSFNPVTPYFGWFGKTTHFLALWGYNEGYLP